RHFVFIVLTRLKRNQYRHYNQTVKRCMNNCAKLKLKTFHITIYHIIATPRFIILSLSLWTKICNHKPKTAELNAIFYPFRALKWENYHLKQAISKKLYSVL